MRAPASVSTSHRPARAAAPATPVTHMLARENAPANAQSQHRLANIPAHAPSQATRANGNLPAPLRSRMEQLSGIALDDVQVKYNSAHPGKLSADAYAQGNTIHVAPGQQRHLPHELWHVVQQRQGRVRPTTRVGAFHVNDNPALEREADVMGAKALVMQAPSAGTAQGESGLSRAVVTRGDASPEADTPVQAMFRMPVRAAATAAAAMAPSAAAAAASQRAAAVVAAQRAAAAAAARRVQSRSANMAAAASSPRRDYHSAANGGFTKFNDPVEREKWNGKPKTMFSSFDSREAASQVNPHLEATVQALKEAGHDVAFDVDLLQSANMDDAPTRAMHERAEEQHIDMTHAGAEFLRSPEETQETDQALINKTMAALQASGVHTAEMTHAHSAAVKKGNNPPPSTSNYEEAAKGLSNVETSTKDTKVSHEVEKTTTTDSNGIASKLQRVRPNKAQTTTFRFKESGPIRKRLQAKIAKRRAAQQ